MQAQAQAAGDTKSTERLKLLRDNLMPLTTFGKSAPKQQAAVESLKDVNTPEEFLDRVIAADPDEATAIAIAARPAARLQVLRIAHRADRGQPGRRA